MKTIFTADLSLGFKSLDMGWMRVDKHRDGYDITVSDYLVNILSPEDALALANALLDDLGLGWLPYPENKPEEGWYLVTTVSGKEKVLDFGEYYECDEWHTGWAKPDDMVLAFRPLPQPYGGDK